MVVKALIPCRYGSEQECIKNLLIVKTSKKPDSLRSVVELVHHLVNTALGKT
jgi:hypothetical protein